MTALYEDSRGVLWVVQQTLVGLACWRDGHARALRIPGTAAGRDVRALTEDSEGALWIGTKGDGLYRLKNGLPPGVLMIDDNWQEDYGKWTFHPGRFTDPKAMMNELHALGFKVMVWVFPFVSPDSDVYRALAKKKAFFMDKPGDPAMVAWWNGKSAMLGFLVRSVWRFRLTNIGPVGNSRDARSCSASVTRPTIGEILKS